MEVVSLVEGEWLSYRGDHFNGEKMSQRWSLMEGEWSSLHRVASSLKEGEWSCYGGDQISKGRMNMLETWSV